jgi:hypothetical protein
MSNILRIGIYQKTKKYQENERCFSHFAKKILAEKYEYPGPLLRKKG